MVRIHRQLFDKGYTHNPLRRIAVCVSSNVYVTAPKVAIGGVGMIEVVAWSCGLHIYPPPNVFWRIERNDGTGIT